jgi:hypothetical protein
MAETIFVDHYLQQKLARFADWMSCDPEALQEFLAEHEDISEYKFCPMNSSMREGKNVIAVSPDIFQSLEILITTQN